MKHENGPRTSSAKLSEGPWRFFPGVTLCLALSVATVSGAQESTQLVFAAGKVELSPVLTWTGQRPLDLPPEQLVGTADNGWVVLQRARDGCVDTSGRVWPQAKERWLLGPGSIHTVSRDGGPCKVSSERRLRQIFANLADCGSGCELSLTVVTGSEAEGTGWASEALFDRLLAESPLMGVRPRHVEALSLQEKVSVRSADLCRRYAESAVAQQLENESKGCGLSGSGWSADLQAHTTWCRQGDNHKASNLERRRASRRRILDQCRPRATSPECAELAATAAALQDENLWLGCGLEGPGWNADFSQHYDHCTSDGRLERLPQLLDQRRSALEACRQR